MCSSEPCFLFEIYLFFNWTLCNLLNTWVTKTNIGATRKGKNWTPGMGDTFKGKTKAPSGGKFFSLRVVSTVEKLQILKRQFPLWKQKCLHCNFSCPIHFNAKHSGQKIQQSFFVFFPENRFDISCKLSPEMSLEKYHQYVACWIST